MLLEESIDCDNNFLWIEKERLSSVMGVQCIYCYIPVNTYKTIYYLHIATSDHWSLSW
jgi:hypothetical protein